MSLHVGKLTDQQRGEAAQQCGNLCRIEHQRRHLILGRCSRNQGRIRLDQALDIVRVLRTIVARFPRTFARNVRTLLLILHSPTGVLVGTGRYRVTQGPPPANSRKLGIRSHEQRLYTRHHPVWPVFEEHYPNIFSPSSQNCWNAVIHVKSPGKIR